MSDVKVLARWNGWCDPCDVDRPLLLAEHGPRGVGAWLHGVGIEDRTLHLTCGVCGQWQAVPQLEEDDPLTDAERAQIEKALREEQERLAAEAELEVLTPSVVRRPLFGRRRAVADAPTEVTDEVTELDSAVEQALTAVAEVAEAPEEPAELPEEAVERPSRFAFRRTPKVEAVEEVVAVDEVEEVTPEVVLAQDVVPARRSLFGGLRRTPKVEVEETEAEVVAEEAAPEPVRSVVPDAEDEPLARWAARERATVVPTLVPAIVSTALVPSRAGRPSPVDIPAPRTAAKPVSVPVPRTAPSPVRSISATDTALLTLLGEGLDVVSAGRR